MSFLDQDYYKGRDFARHQFKRCGLDYQSIGSKEFFKLIWFLHNQFKSSSSELKLKVSTRLKKYNPEFNCDAYGTMKSGFIRCDSHYFEGREAISFNEDGYIGFCGWADTENTKDILIAFYKWIRAIR